MDNLPSEHVQQDTNTPNVRLLGIHLLVHLWAMIKGVPAKVLCISSLTLLGMESSEPNSVILLLSI